MFRWMDILGDEDTDFLEFMAPMSVILLIIWSIFALCVPTDDNRHDSTSQSAKESRSVECVEGE